MSFRLVRNLAGVRRMSLAVPEATLESAPAALVALHSRLALPGSFTLATLARCLTHPLYTPAAPHNGPMSQLGSLLLRYYTVEHLMVTYPRLPTQALRAAVKAYTHDDVLAAMAVLYGIGIDDASEVERHLRTQPADGCLRMGRRTLEPEPGVTRLALQPHADARALVVPALVAGLHAHEGEAAARDFVERHVLSRHVDFPALLEFTQPGRDLAALCRAQGLAHPEWRLVAESGRQSSSAVFVVAVFAGNSKLGEGSGGLIVEARTRAAVHALKSWYLYRPVEPVKPSAEGYRGTSLAE